MYTNEISEWVTEVKVEELQGVTGSVGSFDEVGIEDGDLDPEQIILRRDSAVHLRNGVTTSPM